MVIAASTIIRPSYHNGFAPRDGESRHPGLWQGCVGAWAPCLGPTGQKVLDWSGYKNNCNFNAMEPATDWLVSEGQYTCGFDGSAEFLTVDDSDHIGVERPSTAMTVSVWARQDASASSRCMVMNGDFGSPRDWSWALEVSSTTTVKVFVADALDDGGSNEGTTDGSPWIDSLWTHVAFVYRGSGAANIDRLKIWIHGRDKALTYGGTIPSSLVNPLGEEVAIGSFIGLGRYWNGQLDDIRIYDRALSDAEIILLGRRRGIAYELADVAFPGTPEVAAGGLTIPIAYHHRRRMEVT